MKFKANQKTKTVLSMLVALIVFHCSFVMATPLEIRFSHAESESSPKGLMANRFKELVEKKLGNDVINVKIYPNGTLFKDDEISSALMNGMAELGAPEISKLKQFSKRLQLFDIPFLFVSDSAASNFVNGPYGKRMLRLIRSKGLIGLGYLNNGMKQLSANKIVNKPEVFKDIKFSILNSPVLEDHFKKMNADADEEDSTSTLSKVRDLIKKNDIEANENTWTDTYSSNSYESQPFVTESNHGYLGYMIISSAKFWDSIPESIKPSIHTSLDEAIEYGNKIAKNKAIEDKNNILKSKKAKIHILTVEERKSWVTAMLPLWENYKSEIGSELIRAAASSR